MQPSSTAPHKFVMVAGIDGRFDGVARRYPGHVRYPDSGARSTATDFDDPDVVNTALTQAGVEATSITPDIVREFQVARGLAKRELIRGFLVGERATGAAELWFRLSDDPSGRMRRQKLRAPLSRYLELSGNLIKNKGDAVAFGKKSMYGNVLMNSDPGNHILDYGTVECLETWGTPTLGTHLYAGGVFRRAGGRNCNFVARFDGVAWEPVGSGFDGPVYSLLAVGDYLYAAGEFRRTGDGTRCRGFARWDGTAWIEAGGGIDPSDMATTAWGEVERCRVWGMCAWPLVAPTHIFVAGEFKGVDNETPVLSRNIAGYSIADETWTYTFGGAFDHVSGERRTALLGICATNIGSVDRLCVVGRFGPASGGAPNEGTSPADNNGTTASVLNIKRVALITPDAGGAHVYTDLITDFAGATFTEADQGFPWACVQFDPGSGPKLFVGTMESAALNRGSLQQWDGTSWSESGYSPIGTIFKLRVTNNQLWAVGCFAQARITPGSATSVACRGVLGWPATAITGPNPASSETGLGTPHARTTNIDQSLAVAVSNPTAATFQDIKWFTDAQGVSRYSLGAGYHSHLEGDTFFPRGNVQLSTATFGRYLYVFSSTGAHKTLWWDEESSRFKMDDFGPYLVSLPRPTAALNSGGRQLYGKYSCSFRYWDADRLRATGMSLPSTDISHTDVLLCHRAAPRAHLFMWRPNPGVLQVPTSAASFHTCSCPDSFKQVLLYETQSSGEPDVPAGGRIYLAHRGSVYPNDESIQTNFTLSRAPGSWKILTGQDESWDTGNGESACSLSDLALVEQPSWDVFEDLPGEAARVYAAAHYQGTTFVLEADQEFMVLRWGPTSLLRPEEISPVNSYQTGIKVTQAMTCGLKAVGDYLFLYGGDELYRVQKAGSSVGVVRIADNLPFVHGDAATRLDNYLALATRTDLLLVEPGTGQIKPLMEASRIFLDRWRGSLAPGEDHTLRLAFDSEMMCLYAHHRLLDETLCYWLRTGKVTLLPYNFYDTVATAEDIEGGTTRAYFISGRRWFATPNFDITAGAAQTMAGDFLPMASGLRYNPELVTVGTAALPAWIPDIGGNTVTTLSWAPAEPFEADSADGPKVVAEIAAIFLTGAHAGRAVRVVYNTSDTLYLASQLSPAPSGDDIISLAPPVFYVIGSPLWDAPKTSWNPFSRKVIVAMGLAATNVYAGDGGALYDIGDAKLMQYQVVRPDGLQAREPRSAVGATAQYDTYGATGGISAINTDKTSRNWGSIRVDGNLPMPVLRCDVSDTAFDIHAWLVAGDTRDAGISGPGTGSTPSA